jgi:hypothetical protein
MTPRLALLPPSDARRTDGVGKGTTTHPPQLYPMTRFRPLLLTFFCVALPASSVAQGRARPTPPQVPANMQPPVGKCRIWMDGVSPAQQPAPMDCQTALRQKPASGTVIFGPTEENVTSRGFGTQPRPARQDSATRSKSPERTPSRATPTRPTPVPVRPSARPSTPDTSRPAPRRPDTLAAGAERP